MRQRKVSRIEKFVKKIEPFTYPVDGIGRLAPTGEPYVTVVSCGIKPEGEEVREWYKTDIEAVDAFLEFIEKYTRQAKTVYWRYRPKLFYLPDKPVFIDGDWHYEKRDKPYIVRCRILCSLF